jgi:hypothetical protein
VADPIRALAGLRKKKLKWGTVSDSHIIIC